MKRALGPPLRIALAFFFWAGMVGICRAEEPATDAPVSALRPEEYGISDEVTYNLNPSDFQVRVGGWSDASLDTDSFWSVANGSSGAALAAPLHLPAGVRITSLRVSYFDNHPTETPSCSLSRYTETGTPTAVASVTFPANFSGGDNSVTEAVDPANATVDNETYHYSVQCVIHRSTAEPLERHRLNRVRVRYVRQLSPEPHGATFSDVAVAHPFHRHIEALFSSGITSGCNTSPLEFCPDQAVTRGEMAVFFAKALGLHWPTSP